MPAQHSDEIMRPSLPSFLVAALSVSLLGCGAADRTTAPRSLTSPEASYDSRYSHAYHVKPLQRGVANGADKTVSQTIGILGGTLSIPSAGVTIVVPPGALSAPTTISVTALHGSSVAYEFQPHGLRFRVPLVMTQDLRGTAAQSGGSVNPLQLTVGYFADLSDVTNVTELLGVGVQQHTAVTALWHFSGYIWASGWASDEW